MQLYILVLAKLSDITWESNVRRRLKRLLKNTKLTTFSLQNCYIQRLYLHHKKRHTTVLLFVVYIIQISVRDIQHSSQEYIGSFSLATFYFQDYYKELFPEKKSLSSDLLARASISLVLLDINRNANKSSVGTMFYCLLSCFLLSAKYIKFVCTYS